MLLFDCCRNNVGYLLYQIHSWDWIRTNNVLGRYVCVFLWDLVIGWVVLMYSFLPLSIKASFPPLEIETWNTSFTWVLLLEMNRNIWFGASDLLKYTLIKIRSKCIYFFYFRYDWVLNQFTIWNECFSFFYSFLCPSWNCFIFSSCLIWEPS